MRLFLAIKLSREMRDAVQKVQDSFRRLNVRGNYSPEENLHITLAFIGEFGDPDAVLEAMQQVSFSPFVITMDKVGCFGELWWTGFSETRELEALAGKVRRALSDAAIPYDRKKFKAHVTFLRKADFGKEKVSHISVGPAGMTVDYISLMKSTRGKNGMIYTPIGSLSAR